MFSIKEERRIILVGNNESEETYKQFIDSHYLQYNICGIADEAAVKHKKYIRGLEIMNINTALEFDYYYILVGGDWEENVKLLEKNKLVLYRDFLPAWVLELYYEKSAISYTKMLSLIGEQKIGSALHILNQYQKIAVIYGNKQMSNMVRYLTVTDCFIEDYLIITMPPADAMERNHIKFPPALLEYASLFICQAYVSRNQEYHFEYLISKTRKRCRIVTVPRILWDVYYPQYYSDRKKTSIYKSEDLPYRDYYIEGKFYDNATVEEIYNSINNYDLYTEENLRKRLHINMERMFAEEESCSVKITQFICDNYRTQKLFLGPNQPAYKLYWKLVEQILEIVGYMQPNIRYSVVELDDCKYEMPIYPCVSAKLGLQYERGEWVISKQICRKKLSLEQYVRFYISTYLIDEDKNMRIEECEE